MKLRNKKTGGLANILGEQEFFRVYTDAGWADYGSLAELNEEWEDYKPTEPLIKDEKVRKAVRAWAEANEIVKAFVVMNEHMNWTVYGDDVDRNRFSIELFDRVVSENDETKNYTIAELCGEWEDFGGKDVRRQNPLAELSPYDYSKRNIVTDRTEPRGGSRE